MATEWGICPAAPTMRQVDVSSGPEHCHVDTRMDDFCQQNIFYKINRYFWQCFDIIVCIHVFVENALNSIPINVDMT